MKRIIAFISLILCTVCGAVSVYAGGVTATGAIAPAMISAVLPTTITFGIDPNAEPNYDVGYVYDAAFAGAFRAATTGVMNASGVPVMLYVTDVAPVGSSGLKTTYGADVSATYAPSVVPYNTYSFTGGADAAGNRLIRWRDLTNAQTLKAIAFGFEPVDAAPTGEMFSVEGWLYKGDDAQLISDYGSPVAHDVAGLSNEDLEQAILRAQAFNGEKNSIDISDSYWYTPGEELAVGTIASGETATVAVKSAYGMSWGNTDRTATVTYSVTYTVRPA